MTKKFRAILTDYDNTLAGFHEKIKPNLKKRIIELVKNGLIFSLTTGRSFHGIIKETCEDLNLTSPQIVFGGSQIINPKNESVLWQELIPSDTTHSIITLLNTKNLYTVVETPYCDYSSDGEFVFFFPKKIPVKKISAMSSKPVPKILVVAYKNNLTEKDARELEKEIISQYSSLSVIKFVYDGQWGLDITSEKATKYTAVLEYMKLLNLKPEEVVGIGDNFNDYPLLTACGFKIAMADSPSELKEIADYIAPTEREDGLLKVLNKFF